MANVDWGRYEVHSGIDEIAEGNDPVRYSTKREAYAAARNWIAGGGPQVWAYVRDTNRPPEDFNDTTGDYWDIIAKWRYGKLQWLDGKLSGLL